MKTRIILISLISIAVLTQIIGAVLNSLVISANGGMPTVACAEAIGKWVVLNGNTKFVFLADVIRVWNYALSIGDLLIIAGVTLSMITVWIAIPQGRKLFPLLIVNIIGILLSTAVPDNLILTLIFEITAIYTILVIYGRYLSAKRAKAAIKI
jgi:hypothetical protein